MAEFRRKRRKVCQLCAGKELDYKNADDLRKYINEKVKFYQEELLEHVLNTKE